MTTKKVVEENDD